MTSKIKPIAISNYSGFVVARFTQHWKRRFCWMSVGGHCQLKVRNDDQRAVVTRLLFFLDLRNLQS